MQDQLIGYLLGALEPAEQLAVERQLRDDATLRSELHLLQRMLAGFDVDRGSYDPPEGLTEQTLELVAGHTSRQLAAVRMSPDRSPPSRRSTWSLVDLMICAGVLIVASLIFIPAVDQSRQSARVAGCQNNLRKIGVALASYSDQHHRYFPQVPTQGPLAVAGVYAHTLIYSGYLEDPNLVICPATTLAEKPETFKVPTYAELKEAAAPKLAQLQRAMGGSYGYSLGYVSKGRYRSTKNLGRSTFALVADSPTCAPINNQVSENHVGLGQNVLFEDGHVETLIGRTSHGCGDDIFLNDQGEVSAGMHRDDAVIAPSPAKPIIWPVALEGE